MLAYASTPEGYEHTRASVLVQHDGLVRLKKYNPRPDNRVSLEYHNFFHGIHVLWALGIMIPDAVREGKISPRKANNTANALAWHDDEQLLGPVFNELQSGTNVAERMEKPDVKILNQDAGFVYGLVYGSIVTVRPGSFTQWVDKDEYSSKLHNDSDVALFGADYSFFMHESAIPFFRELHTEVEGSDERRDAMYLFLREEVDILRSFSWQTEIAPYKFPHKDSNADVIERRLNSNTYRDELLDLGIGH